MKRAKRIASLSGLLAALSAPAFAQVSPVPPLMNFQARLAKPDGTPLPDGTYTVTVSLWDIATGGSIMTDQLWTETETVTVHNGVFSATLGATTALTGSLFSKAVYLEVQVGSDAPLAPRQQLVTVAHAFKADLALSVPPASITDANIVSVDFSKITNFPTGMGGGWNLTGNAALDSTVNFLGTTDLQPLIFKVNGQQTLRFDYAKAIYDTANGYYYEGNNVTGGYAGNSIKAGVVGGVISGGGLVDSNGAKAYPNKVFDQGGAIVGGINNTVGTDNASLTASAYAFIGGGSSNTAMGYASFVGGGQLNGAVLDNTVVGGGFGNVAYGSFSSVPGGYENTALGKYSFAAGSNAVANHDGAFVWADSQSGSFASSRTNSFNLRAAGGMILEAGTDFGMFLSSTNGEKNRYLDLLNSWQTPSASGLKAGGILCADSFSYANPGKNDLVVKGFVGIGTPAPQSQLDVNGNIIERGPDFDLRGRGGGIGNNGGLGRALVDGGSGGLVLNFANDFGGVRIDSGVNIIGGTTTHFVNIVGGSDVAEPYMVAAIGDVRPLPGMVVAIDAAQIGQMRIVGKAYDKTVSGIISGANGIQPGITLRQKGTIADGEFPVASIGRVWCFCDADANGPIEAGDMLTTSDTPGHAMRVTDYNRANGSIIGKAMSPLKSGKGLVLVLVSLK